MFQEFELNGTNVKQVSHRSDLVQSISAQKDLDSANTKDFLLPGSTCAVEVSSTSVNKVWFVHITAQCTTQNIVVDDYGHTIPHGHSYLEGHYLEKVKSTSKEQVYKMTSNKKFCFCKESVVYFVHLAPTKDNLFLTAADFVDILSYVQHTSLSCI